MILKKPINKKQVKITKLFRKGSGKTKPPEDCDELQQEVQELERRLQEKQTELFQIQRDNCRKKAVPPKQKDLAIVKEEEICVRTSLETIKRDIELMTMLMGVEVQSVEGDHCCIVYHMQHQSDSLLKHGLRIDKHPDGNIVSKSNLPLGFNLKAVEKQHNNIMKPDCLLGIRRALVAYYDRLDQCKDLQKLLNIGADIFKHLDGSHVEISFRAQRHDDDEEEDVSVTLILDYMVEDIRPKTYCFLENGLLEEVSEVLKQQCAVFKKKPLRKAFQHAFMDDVGPYRLVARHGPRTEEIQQKPPKRFRPNKNNYNNDDTFLPEECSDQSDDENLSQ